MKIFVLLLSFLMTSICSAGLPSRVTSPITYQYVSPSSGYSSNVLVTIGAKGDRQDASAAPVKQYALQVIKKGVVPTWDVVLEGSLDGVHYTTLLEHTNASGDGVNVFSDTHAYPARYFRSRVVNYLGDPQGITVVAIGE